MTANDLYRAGRLADALAAQTQAVKDDPSNHAKRLFLFELAVFSGDLDKAGRQIAAIRYDDPELQMATVQYARLVEGERTRRRLFSEGVRPKVAGTPPDHVGKRLDALDLIRTGQSEKAAALLNEANAAALPTARVNDGAPAEIRDADDLFGSVLEVIAGNDYIWLAMEQVESIAVNPPRFPRDLYWRPARLEAGGTTADVFLPALYPGSADAADDAIKLGRQTDWIGEEGQAPVRGLGGRLWLVGEEPMAITEWRTLTRG
jgi:type VI secretion system protein ImpE